MSSLSVQLKDETRRSASLVRGIERYIVVGNRGHVKKL